jgi:hypothetical protein
MVRKNRGRTVRPFLAVSLVSLLLAGLSGCAGSPKPAPAPEANFQDLGLEATATTGVLRGVVVDAAVRPVAGAAIRAAGPEGSTASATTNAEGLFGIDGLAPGDWFVTANKTGFVQTQQAARVDAGVAEPAIIKILLRPDPSTAPFYESYVLAAFIQCSVRPGFLALQCGVTNDDVVHAEYTPSKVPEFVQSEMVWQSTQAFGDELSLSIRCLPGTDPANKCPEGQRGIARSEGKSPQVARINRTLIDTWAIGVDPVVVDLFAFGRSDLDFYNESQVDSAQQPVTGKPCMDWNGVVFPAGTCIRMTGPGFIVNQKVDVFTQLFYGFKPPEGWQFSVDGVPQVPT